MKTESPEIEVIEVPEGIGPVYRPELQQKEDVEYTAYLDSLAPGKTEDVEDMVESIEEEPDYDSKLRSELSMDFLHLDTYLNPVSGLSNCAARLILERRRRNHQPYGVLLDDWISLRGLLSRIMENGRKFSSPSLVLILQLT